MIVPYVALQLSGLQILLRIAGYGAYDATASVCIGFIVLALFVFSAGLRGTAWASIVKDVLVLGAVTFAGIAIPMRFFGSPGGDVRSRVAQLHPQMLVASARRSAFHGTTWYVSTVLLSAIGFFMGPHIVERDVQRTQRRYAAPQRHAAYRSIKAFVALDDLRRAFRQR